MFSAFSRRSCLDGIRDRLVESFPLLSSSKIYFLSVVGSRNTVLW